MKRFLFRRDTPTLTLLLLIAAVYLSGHVSDVVITMLVIAAFAADAWLPRQTDDESNRSGKPWH